SSRVGETMIPVRRPHNEHAPRLRAHGATRGGGRHGGASAAPSSIPTVRSAPEFHRICEKPGTIGCSPDSARGLYRRWGLAPRPEGVESARLAGARNRVKKRGTPCGLAIARRRGGASTRRSSRRVDRTPAPDPGGAAGVGGGGQ